MGPSYVHAHTLTRSLTQTHIGALYSSTGTGCLTFGRYNDTSCSSAPLVEDSGSAELLISHLNVNLCAITHQLDRAIWASVWVTVLGWGVDTGLQSTLLSSLQFPTHTSNQTTTPVCQPLWHLRMLSLSARSLAQSQHALLRHKWPSRPTKRALLFPEREAGKLLIHWTSDGLCQQ